jgi:ATP-dependent phosphoenolpyruvate carboxykinase
MLIRPTEEELANFGEPDFIIYNAGQFPANRFTKGMSSTTSVEINFKRMEMVILGTEYAGEMKKGVFSVMVCDLSLRAPRPRLIRSFSTALLTACQVWSTVAPFVRKCRH